MRPAYKRTSVFLVALLIILSNISYVSADYNLEYDNNGNLIQDDKFSYEYDGFNQLIKIKEDNNLIAEYFYDQNGERIKKAEYSGRSREPVSITYYIGDFVRTVEGDKVTDSIYYYNNGQLVAKEENNKKYYYHPDYLGSTNLITDENGKMVSALSYLPFGESLSDNNERFTFTGQEQDEESNLMYYGARYYNPSSGRFIQPDSVIQDIYNPQNLNRYSYVLNNPYKYVDNSGNYVESALDVASLIWSVRDIKQDSGKILNWVSLGADIVTLSLPGIAAGGAIIKGTTKTVKGLDKTNDAVRAFDKGKDVFKSEKLIVDPKEIRFTQDYISSTMRGGENIRGIIGKLKSGKMKPSDLHPIRVVEKDGLLYSLDNRRLYIFQKAGIRNINVQKLDMNNPKNKEKFLKKITTENKGKTIKVRDLPEEDYFI